MMLVLLIALFIYPTTAAIVSVNFTTLTFPNDFLYAKSGEKIW
jgi:hypothetical protein